MSRRTPILTVFVSILSLALLTACPSKNKNKPSKVSSSKKAQKEGCADTVKDFSLWLKVLEKITQGGHGPPTTTLAKSDVELPLLGGRRITITIKADKGAKPLVLLERKEIEAGVAATKVPIEALTKELAVIESNQRVIRRGWKLQEVQLDIHPDAPWSVVAAVLRTLSQKREMRVALTFATREFLPRPRALDEDPELRKLGATLDIQKRVALLGQLWQRGLYDRCKGSRVVLGGTSGQEPHHRIATMVQRFPAALKDCECNADLAAVKALLYHSLHVRPMAVAWLRVGPKGKALTISGKGRWRDVHKKLVGVKDVVAPAVGG